MPQAKAIVPDLSLIAGFSPSRAGAARIASARLVYYRCRGPAPFQGTTLSPESLKKEACT